MSLSKLFVVADSASFRKRLESDEKKKKKKKRSTSNLLDVRFVQYFGFCKLFTQGFTDGNSLFY
jgi:hypothetical protein